jgi:hypothetical protein
MRGASGRTRLATFALAALVAITAFASGWFPPYRANYVIDAAGIGPFMLYDAFRGTAPIDRTPGILWSVVAIAGAFGLACLGALLVGVLARARSLSPLAWFSAAALAAYLAPFLLTDYFDRYLLFALPFLFVLWAELWGRDRESARTRRAIAAAWILASLTLSAVATHDYFAWNRARWDAIRMAERLGGTAATIDGGLEYNALHREATGARTAAAGKSWWWVADDRFVVAFSAIPGYEVVETFKVGRWLARSPAEVKLLRRKA